MEYGLGLWIYGNHERDDYYLAHSAGFFGTTPLIFRNQNYDRLLR